jgi:SAM-dependent methyltransferase
MAAPDSCRICSGTVTLLYPGSSSEGPNAEAFAPTNHEVGLHGDLYRCNECGTVHQPALPSGTDLHALYRDMEDPEYLSEEAGRRATAGRLIEMIAKHVPSGRLLDVGCGHGLLLDEARRRGYDVRGIELSASAARYARDVLNLDVREITLEQLDPERDGRFEAIVLADVIEHLDDPVGAIDKCIEMLAPGGALMVVTPDPSSPTARIAGRRWWGYVPAHTYLLPRLTLRELLSARGLIISDDVNLVRTFTWSYWLSQAGDRGGPLGAGTRAIARTPLGRRPLSLSLGDERVVLAHKTETIRAQNPIYSPRGEECTVQAVLPAYNASATLPDVAKEMPPGAADRALVVDDASSDDTSEVALRYGFDVVRHPANRGYGANQKTCYVRAILDGADVVVMVHADNQYDPALLADMVRPIVEGEADVVMGSRLLEDETLAGGMPRWKWLGNRFLTEIENMALRRSFSEYHTGYRAFSTEFLRTIPFLRNNDGFVFDQEIFAQIVARGVRVRELPIPTRYFLEASSVSFTTSVEYGLRTLWVLARFRLDEKRGRWPLLRRPAVRIEAPRQPDSEREPGGLPSS